MPNEITQLLASVRGFLLDLDGTFFTGERLMPGALDFMAALDRLGKDFLFLTNNSSGGRTQYAQKLARLGFPISEDKIFTSGEATALTLQAYYPGIRLFVAGTPALEAEFTTHGFRLDAQDPQQVVLGFDTTLTYAKLCRLCELVRAGLPYTATHPDLNCPTETGPIPDIGATIAYVKASTGREPDQVIGKPNRTMGEAAARRLRLPFDSLAMVGDRLYTDIALGQACGIPAFLVLSGETHREDLADSPFRPTAVFENLGELARELGDLA